MNHVARPLALTAAALHEKLLGSDSATAVLELLCGSPVSIIRDEPAEPIAPDAEQRLRLKLDGATAWAHRGVQLQAGSCPLSRADLWYIPSRLDPDMAAALLGTTIPFGRIVAALNPRRLTLGARFGMPGDPFALHHHALLTIEAANGTLPIAEVHERYFASSFPL